MKHILEKAKTWLRERTFRQRRTICIGLMLLFGLVGCMGAAMIPTNPPLALIGLLGVLAMVFLDVCWCRCPHCGRYLDRVAFWADYCPGCGEKLNK